MSSQSTGAGRYSGLFDTVIRNVVDLCASTVAIPDFCVPNKYDEVNDDEVVWRALSKERALVGRSLLALPFVALRLILEFTNILACYANAPRRPQLVNDSYRLC